MSTKEKIIIGSIVGIVVLGIALLFIFGRKTPNPHPYKMTLEVWGPVDDSDAFNDIFRTYKALNPQITDIIYKKIPYDTYKKEVIEAMASGQGPDILLIHNTWLSGFSDKIIPASASQFSEQSYKQTFADVCYNDFFANGQVWAAPMALNSLGLYYNRDLFNEAGITSPPRNWDEFVADTRRLTKINSSANDITQSGAAMGLTSNINRPTDILTMLMFQGGLEIVDPMGRITLGDTKMVNGAPVSPAANALNFYTQFARSNSASYSWNPRMHYSVDTFAEGNLAMMFNYSWQIPTIKSKAPKLNFDIAPVPQLPNAAPANFADYWGLSVVKNKQIATVSNDVRTQEAWSFIKFLTTKPAGPWVAPKSAVGGSSIDSNFDPTADYLKKTNQPAARRDLIELQKTDPQLGAFAWGNLIAKSWHQKDPEANETIFMEMIDKVTKGQASPLDAVTAAGQRLDQIMRVKN